MKTIHPPGSAAQSVADTAALKRRLPDPGMRRALREQHGLTQIELAHAVGPTITRQTVSNWESGRRTPRGAALAAYVAILDRLRVDLAS